jgi:RNA polymerase sigma-70 factor (ECF subfamily)
MTTREAGMRPMQDQERLAERFEEHRPHLRAVAYRMLGSLSDAEDAVQEAWLRLSRSDVSDVQNLGGWLTTVVARLCLNMLNARRTRREEPFEVRVPEPIVSGGTEGDPEHEALLADSVGLALQVVLETLAPAERLAFVLHDMFAVPFDEIASMVGRSPTAARQLASRARRRVQTAANVPDPDLGRQWQVVDAFMEAARNRDYEALVTVLDPDVVLRADAGSLRGAGASRVLRGARAVARGAASFQAHPGPGRVIRRSLVNGAAGVVVFEQGRLVSVMGFTVAGGRIVEMDALADPERLARLDLAGLLP